MQRGHSPPRAWWHNRSSSPAPGTARLLPDPHFELIRHDVTFPLLVEVDDIYNLACLLEECPIGNACMKAIEVEEVVRHAAGMPAPGLGRISSTGVWVLAGAQCVPAAQGQNA